MSDHLTPEDFFEFIDRGGGTSGLAGHHLTACPECLHVLDMVLLAEAPATAEEEAALDELPAVTVIDVELEPGRECATWQWCWPRGETTRA